MRCLIFASRSASLLLGIRTGNRTNASGFMAITAVLMFSKLSKLYLLGLWRVQYEGFTWHLHCCRHELLTYRAQVVNIL